MKKENQTPFKAILNTSRLEEGVVASTEIIEGRLIIYVRCDNRKIHPEDLPTYSLTQCLPLNPFGTTPTSKTTVRPAEGTKCVILFKNPEDFTRAYYIGSLEQKTEEIELTPASIKSEGGTTFKNDTGEGYNFSGGKASIFSAKSSVLIENEKVALNNKQSSLTLGINGFQVESFTGKGESLGLISLNQKNLFLRSKGEVAIGAESGEVKIISSGTSIKNSSIFELKAREMKFEASSKVAFAMGTKVENIAGNILNPLSLAPAYQIKIISGGYSLSAAQGDIEIAALNTLFYNKLKLRNGTSIGLTVSEISLAATDIEIKNRTTALISKIVVGKGMIDIKSMLTLDINSKSINIKGDIMITMGAPLFVLNGGQVIPDPSKPFFNMLPTCLFTGVPHGGSKIVG